MEDVKNNYKFPRLNIEEWDFFLKEDVFYTETLRKKYGIWRPLYIRIGRSLQTLAVAKILGVEYRGVYKKNKKEAIEHHLKACAYDPSIVLRCPNFRKMAGLLFEGIN